MELHRLPESVKLILRRPYVPKPDTRLEHQRTMKLPAMLADLPTQCDIGGKKNSQGNTEYWRGYKLHLDVADGQIPISAVLTSASLHDSQVAIPLATMTTPRVTYLMFGVLALTVDQILRLVT